MTKGYKATYNYKCINQTYEVGQEYKLDGKPIICYYGFHYCINAKKTLNYYSLTSNFKLLEIEDLSNDTITDYDKSCSNHIKIIREITDKDELFSLLGQEYTYDEKGRKLTYKDSSGFWYERAYDESGKTITHKDSKGYCKEYPFESNISKDCDFTFTNNLFYLPYIPLKDRQSS